MCHSHSYNTDCSHNLPHIFCRICTFIFPSLTLSSPLFWKILNRIICRVITALKTTIFLASFFSSVCCCRCVNLGKEREGPPSFPKWVKSRDCEGKKLSLSFFPSQPTHQVYSFPFLLLLLQQNSCLNPIHQNKPFPPPSFSLSIEHKQISGVKKASGLFCQKILKNMSKLELKKLQNVCFSSIWGSNVLLILLCQIPTIRKEWGALKKSISEQ